MTTALCISLGHNASAIMVCDGVIVAGYEEERLSGVKSDSHYPILAINRLLHDHPVAKEDLKICISHWFLLGQLPNNDFKHIQLSNLRSIAYEHNWSSVCLQYTHHDAHMEAARVFAGREFCEDALCIVADGFGTVGEVVSIYLANELLHRSFGFAGSYGLLYQYATSYLGLKENQDEYKLLGYEASYIPTNDMDELVSKASHKYLRHNLKNSLGSPLDPICSLHALERTKLDIYEMLDTVVNRLQLKPSEIMPAIAYFVQAVLEKSIIDLLAPFGDKRLIVSGGVFMNVKLNAKLLEKFDEVCIYPICGDQGAALGVYNHVYNDLVWPNHVYWGERDLSEVCEVEYVDSTDIIVDELLNGSGIIQVITGSMEFGSRALCHTTTLALPTKENVAKINEINLRDTVMPMAPVMLQSQAKELLLPHAYIHKSLEYMVCTVPVKYADMPGASHQYLRDNVATCRPQVVADDASHFIVKILGQTGPLINTSMNAHGQPIVFERASIEKCLNIQKHQIRTVILNEK